MIDASALLEVLLATDAGERVSARVYREGETLHAPHLLDLEIIHVLRRGCLIGKLLPSRAAEALADLSGLRLVRHPHQPYVPRIWQLRHSLMAYDAGVGGARRSARILGHHARWALSLGSRHRAKIELVKWRALVA